MHAPKWLALLSLASSAALAEPGSLPACPAPDASGTCFGEVKFSTGDRYLGEMTKFKAEGTGVMFGADGAVKQVGTWAAAKLVTPGDVDFTPYLVNYPKFSAQLQEAIKLLDVRREHELVHAYLDKEAASQKWSDRVEHAVDNAAKDWLDGLGAKLVEPTPPQAPPPPALGRESWESTKEFEARLATAKADLKKEVQAREAEYKAKLAAFKAAQKDAAKAKAARQKRLGAVKKDFAQQALGYLNLTATQKACTFDPDKGALLVDLSIGGGEPERWEFKNAPVELRKTALAGGEGIAWKPDFLVKESGQVSIKAMRAEANGQSAVGSPGKK